MLNNKYLGLPVWVWILIAGFLVYNNRDSLNLSKNTCDQNQKKESEEFTESQNTIKVFNFNTEWCGWSKRFQPEWNKLSEMVAADPTLSHIQAIDVKCDEDENKQMCEDYKVPGFPYVVVEKNNVQTPYNGERTADAILSSDLLKL
jgi:thiol-disulfide isomerase/thioredoxin